MSRNRAALRDVMPAAIALAVHVVGAAALLAVGRGHGGAVAHDAREGVQEIELVAEPAGGEGPAAGAMEQLAAGIAAAAVAAEPARQANPGSAPRLAEEPVVALATGAEGHRVEGEGTTGDGSDAGAGWFNPSAGLDLGLGTMGAMKVGTLRPGEGEVARPGPAPRPVSTTGGVIEALDKAEVARGMGHGGPVRSAVDAAAHRPDAPTFGTAMFSVALGSDGSVQVSLASASGDNAQWDALRSSIRDAVAKAPKRTSVPGKGVRVTIKVEAKEQFASGNTPTPAKEQGAAASGSIGAMHETKERVTFELPSATLTYKTRNCGVGVTANPGGLSFGGGCEPGVAMRVVSTRVVAEERL